MLIHYPQQWNNSIFYSLAGVWSGSTCGEDKPTKTGQTRLISDPKHIWFNWKGQEEKFIWTRSVGAGAHLNYGGRGVTGTKTIQLKHHLRLNITTADTKNKSDCYWWRAAASVYSQTNFTETLVNVFSRLSYIYIHVALIGSHKDI